jgi:hypothetical protein
MMFYDAWEVMVASTPEAPPMLDRTKVYQDESWPERECDRCGRLYRGPTVYCSFNCAVRDA